MKTTKNRILSLLMVAVCSQALANAETKTHFDIVINNGRVIDPETGLDAIRSVGIVDDKIKLISSKVLAGTKVIDASGLVVSPGFIDMHAHGQDILAARVQAFDGVTTALDLEAGTMPVIDFYDKRAKEGRPINYGASVNWANARIATMLNIEPEADLNWFIAAFGKKRWQINLATPAQLEKIRSMVEEGLDQGGLGIGVLLGYAPGTGYKEFFEMNKLAAARGVPTFTHARYLSMLEPRSSFQGMNEVIAAASGTGAHTHIAHLNSLSLRDISSIGEMISNAQKLGLRVTTEAYPYGAGSTGIGAAMFKEDKWRERIGGITANNFDVDGKRLTEEELTFYKEKKPNTTTVVHFLEEDNASDMAYLEESLLFPGGVVASDGVDWRINNSPISQYTWPLPKNAWSHPRSAGTYAKFIGTFVRERKQISLKEAIKRVSYGPAKILESSVPQMKFKGRVQVGADADLVVFDLNEVSDKATYKTPAQLSVGFEYVIVNGVTLIEQGQLDINAMPGKPIRNPIKASLEK